MPYFYPLDAEVPGVENIVENLCVRGRITKYEYENSKLFQFLRRTNMRYSAGLPP